MDKPITHGLSYEEITLDTIDRIKIKCYLLMPNGLSGATTDVSEPPEVTIVFSVAFSWLIVLFKAYCETNSDYVSWKCREHRAQNSYCQFIPKKGAMQCLDGFV